jgi:hypothetical protein
MFPCATAEAPEGTTVALEEALPEMEVALYERLYGPVDAEEPPEEVCGPIDPGPETDRSTSGPESLES